MRQENGLVFYETDDVVQVVKGGEWGVFGVVLENMQGQLKLWGRQPGYLGSQAYLLQVDAKNVMYVGQGKIRPLKPGEERRAIPDVQAAGAPTGSPAPSARPVMRQRTTPSSRRHAPAPAPTVQPQQTSAQTPKAKTQQPNAVTQSGPTAEADVLLPGVHAPVDSDMVEQPKPKPQEPIDPKLLQPAVYHGLSAREMHGLDNPKQGGVPAPPQPQEQHASQKTPSPQVQAQRPDRVPGGSQGQPELQVHVERTKKRKVNPFGRKGTKRHPSKAGN